VKKWQGAGCSGQLGSSIQGWDTQVLCTPTTPLPLGASPWRCPFAKGTLAFHPETLCAVPGSCWKQPHSAPAVLQEQGNNSGADARTQRWSSGPEIRAEQTRAAAHKGVLEAW